MEKTCTCCGCIMENEDDMYYLNDNDSTVLCEDCYNSETRTCEHCGERIWNDQDEGDNMITLCRNCRDDYYCECHECGSLIHNDDACYDDEDSDYAYCRRCYNELKPRLIHSYNYKPEPIFYGDDTMYMGIELEIDKGGESEDNAEQLYQIANIDEEHIYIKHDGSIDDGMEIVTHPMTLEYHMNTMPWKELSEKARELGYKSHQTNTCGLHIHVNKNFFSSLHAEQEECISRVLYFVERFWEELIRFSRRTPNQLQRWASRYGIKQDPKSVFESAKGQYNRYTCINLKNYATIEFRIFKGTLKANTILATIQLVHRICQMAKYSSDEEITSLSWPSFVEQIRDPELIQYLKERRLYINEVTGEDSDEC